ncbi:hypothetical protein ABH924_004353 [Arthrobacter sp. GAS37]|uniref:hypothetical protein n=1 Tax=Arthrobacter sp. GAS37 TaxID=3156261 RepID=UPI003838FCDF
MSTSQEPDGLGPRPSPLTPPATGEGNRRKRSIIKKASSAVLAAALLAGAGVSMAAPAQAFGGTDAPGTHRVGASIQIAPPAGGFGTWTTWAGTFNTANDNKPALCITENIPAGMTPGGGTPFTSDPQIMYLIGVYGNTTDVLTAEGLAYLGHTRDDPAGAAQWINSPDPNIGAIKAKAAALLAEANANAGPYTVAPKVAFNPGSTKAGTTSNTQLVSASGTVQSPVPGILTYINANGTGFANTGDTGSWTAAASGTVQVSESVPNVPAATGTAYVVPGQQTMLVAGDRTTVTGAGNDVVAQTDFQPVATSNAVQIAQKGDKLSNVLHVTTSTGNPNDWAFANGAPVPATFQVDVYQDASLVPSATLPASAKKIGTGSGSVSGPGDLSVNITSGATTAPAAGTYYYVAQFIKASQPANLQQYFTGDWTETNLATQASVVKATPTAVTTAIDNGNGTIADKITMQCDSTDTVNTVMTVTPVLNSSAAAPVTGGTTTAPADNKIQATLPAVTLHCGETVTTAPVAIPWDSIVNDYWNANPSIAKPTLYFTETAPTTPTTNQLHPVYLHQDESLVQTNPTVSTQASANGTVPVTATDLATVTGTVPTGTGVSTAIDWKLFKFAQDTTGSVQAVCMNPFWTSASPVNVPAAGAYTSAPVTLTDSGTYGYVETLTVTYPGTSGVKTAVLHTGACGETSESVVAFPVAAIVTPDKPELVAPLANTGDITPHQGTNDLLLVGGLAGLGAMILALITIGAVRVQKRKAAAMNTGDDTTHADELI